MNEGLDHRADRVRRIVEGIPWWATYVMGATGIIMITMQALVSSGKRTTFIVSMGAISLSWVAMCAFWAKLAKSSIKSHSNMIDEYEHLFTYVMAMNAVVKESLDALSTYDRDRAIELAHDLDALATKSLYDSFWRGDPREESSDTHKQHE